MVNANREIGGELLAIVPHGTGVAGVHTCLEEEIPGYSVIQYAPRMEYFPPFLWGKRRFASIIHAPPDHAIFVASRSVPLIVTFHNYVLDARMRPFSSFFQRLHYASDLRLYTRLALRRASVVTAVSECTAQLVREDMGFSGVIEVIPNGVDVERFQPSIGTSYSGPLRVLFCGNLTRRKGAFLLPEIARLAGGDVRIYYTTNSARVSVRERGWSKLEPVGRVPYCEMPKLYRGFDVLLLPTVREGMSLAVLEAMASGLAIVTSDAGSNRELVRDGVGGVLCEVGDPEAYAVALRALAADRDLVHAMGNHNRLSVERKHTARQMVNGYRAVFERVLGHSLGS